MTKSIYISPSMQENNVGVCGYGTEEERMNQIADVTERILYKYGLIVYRNKPEWTLKKAVEDSNRKKPNLHFALHSNGGSGRGCEIYAYTPDGEGEKAARAIYSEIEHLTPTSDRGVKFNKKLYELNSTDAPAVLIEVAFHDDVSDANWIISNIEAIGTALAKGILKYFNIQFQDENSNLDDELKLLQEYGIIDSPEYWRENAVKGKIVAGEYAAILIKRVIALLQKG